MPKMIAETAWHHEGDFGFMKNLVTEISQNSTADVVKMHITLNFNEYMSKDHQAYALLKPWVFSERQWLELIQIVRSSKKELMLLVNDTAAIEFASSQKPEYIEIHSACLNVPRLYESILKKFDEQTKIIIGIGGCSLEEIDKAVQIFREYPTVLMFGFQNYPTSYEDINLLKIRKIKSLYGSKEFGYADHTSWDNEHNELITLLVSSHGMDYIEKHVTTEPGLQRTDFSAAITIKMFNNLCEKANLIKLINGDGLLKLNSAEEEYSKYGPNKMAGVAMSDLKAGEIFTADRFTFVRTSQTTALSQISLLEKLGTKLVRDIKTNEIFDLKHFDDEFKYKTDEKSIK